MAGSISTGAKPGRLAAGQAAPPPPHLSRHGHQQLAVRHIRRVSEVGKGEQHCRHDERGGRQDLVERCKGNRRRQLHTKQVQVSRRQWRCAARARVRQHSESLRS